MNTSYTGLSGQELVTIHNQLAGSDRQLKRWSKSKALLIEKIEALKAETEVEEIADSSGTVPAFDDAEPVEAKKPTVKELVLILAADPSWTCADIAGAVNAELGTSTTARSVASVICVFNRTADEADRIPARERKKQEA